MAASENEKDQSELQRVISLAKNSLPRDSSGFLLQDIVKLDLFGANIASLPASLPRLLPNLTILFCANNQFEKMPEIIGQCPKLQMVSFKSNKIRFIEPEALQPQLQWLILTDNAIKNVPSTIGRCKKLKKLMLSGNQLENLPSEISECHSLELIRLAVNNLQNPPMELLKLPKISWIALSDNPFLKTTSTKVCESIHLDTIMDPALDNPNIGVELGKGASGITRKYYWNGMDVAVKEYYSTITSDGNPNEERNISMVASSLNCDSLVKVIGKTKSGNLVMQLLENYEVLAMPPSLESCTRDVYHPDKTISVERGISIVDKLLKTLDRLHENGICHGDFYGHNILISKVDESAAWLTDFGASFFYDTQSEYGKYIQLIERRSFSHLLGEISKIVNDTNFPSKVHHFQAIIQSLLEQCESLNFSDLYAKWKKDFI